jgi:hypothetical protein
MTQQPDRFTRAPAPPRRPCARRRLAALAWAALVAHIPLAGAAIPIAADATKNIVLDYSWGYNSGLKQPHGTYHDGLSVHAISRWIRPNPNTALPEYGSPDFIVAYDENTGVGSAFEHPAAIPGDGANPGGNVMFVADPPAGEDGRLWWVLGGRADEIPLDIARSSGLFDPGHFNVVLNDFETFAASTAPTISVVDDMALVLYRYHNSGSSNVVARFQRYDVATGTPVLAATQALGIASSVTGMGTITIEQIYSRWDPRKQAVAATWQWFAKEQTPSGTLNYYGSNPFIYTDDLGATWRFADGTQAVLPLTYANQQPKAAPYDHLAVDESVAWYPRDLGFGPGGTPWTVLPTTTLGTGTPRNANFYAWMNNAWAVRNITLDLDTGDPLACGATLNYLVCAYSNRAQPGVLLARASADDGNTWSDPVQVDATGTAPSGTAHRISWVSFVQPSDAYEDDAARFFVGYYDPSEGLDGRDFRNNIRFVRLRAGASNQPPNVEMTAPTDGASFPAGSTVALAATAADPDGDAVSVTWTANGNPIAAPWTPAAGAYTVVATAEDSHGATATDSAAITVTAGSQKLLAATVIGAGANVPRMGRINDVTGGAQDLSTNWSNDGQQSTAWFTLDLGSAQTVEKLLVAPRGDLRYNFTISIGNTLTNGKASGGSTGNCSIRGPTPVPTSLELCPVGGTGRYVTVQGDRPWLIFHGIEAWGAAPAAESRFVVTVHDVGANDPRIPQLIDTAGGVQNLTTSWSNDGLVTTAWFTLDLGASRNVTKLLIAPRGTLRYNLAITIGNTLASGKVSGGAAASCSIRGPTQTPTTLDTCPAAGTGRYVTVQGDRPWLIVHGVEVWGLP